MECIKPASESLSSVVLALNQFFPCDLLTQKKISSHANLDFRKGCNIQVSIYTNTMGMTVFDLKLSSKQKLRHKF